MSQPPPPTGPPPSGYPPPPTPSPPARKKTSVWVWLVVGFFGFVLVAGTIGAIVDASDGTLTLGASPSPSPVSSASITPTPTVTPERKVVGSTAGFTRDGADIRTTLTMSNRGRKAGVAVCIVTAYDASGKALASDTFSTTGSKLAPGASRLGTAVVQMVDEADAEMVDAVRAEDCHLE